MTNDETTTRVVQWVARGYEGAFTQYTVTPDGTLYVAQITTRDNLARALTQPGPFTQKYSTQQVALDAVDIVIANRTEDGSAVELDGEGNPLAR